MGFKSRMHGASPSAAMEQEARVGSTRTVIYEDRPLARVLGAYSPEREQIVEMSFEMNHEKPWPSRKIKHIRPGYEAARAARRPRLFRKIQTGYTGFPECILPARDWSSGLLMPSGIERGAFSSDRGALGRMSRYVEAFIRRLIRRQDAPAGGTATAQGAVPDRCELTGGPP